MKRGWFFITLFFVLILIFNSTLFNVAGQINSTSPVSYDFSTKTFTSNSNALLEKDVAIPSNLEIPARIVFGFTQNDNLNFSVFIVLIAIWTILLFFIHAWLEIVPLFGSGIKSWIGAVIINCLIAFSGGIKDSAMYFFSFTFSNQYGILKLIIILFILVIIGYLLIKISKILKNKMGLEEAKQIGFRIGAGV